MRAVTAVVAYLSVALLVGMPAAMADPVLDGTLDGGDRQKNSPYAGHAAGRSPPRDLWQDPHQFPRRLDPGKRRHAAGRRRTSSLRPETSRPLTRKRVR